MKEKGGAAPQFYGVDLDPAAIPRSLKSLRDAAIDQHCLLFHGTLKDFHRDVPITPTMVFVDGDHSYEGVLADLKLLSTFLAPGTPVMCHDYHGIEGVKRGVNEAIATGFYEMMGLFAGSVLLRTSPLCTGVPRGLGHRTFEQIRDALLKAYLSPEVTPTSPVNHAANRQITIAAHQELRIGSDIPGSSGRGQWPYVRPQAEPLPATLPDGRPWPKISIVTPTLNQGKFIERTILSVLNQDYPSLEYVVMDGGSIDETLSILARYSHRIRHVSEKDAGQSNAINKGMRLCTGELLTWLNSDDMLATDALAGMAMAFYSSGADMVAGVCQVQKDGGVLNRHMTTCGDGPLPLDDLLDLDGIWMQGQFFYQPEVMFTRSLWERAGGRVDESLHYSMDYEMWLRFAEQGARLHAIGRTIALFGVHAEQKTNRVEDFLPEFWPQCATRLSPGRAPPRAGAADPHQKTIAHRLLQRSRVDRWRGHRPSSARPGPRLGWMRSGPHRDFTGRDPGANLQRADRRSDRGTFAGPGRHRQCSRRKPLSRGDRRDQLALANRICRARSVDAHRTLHYNGDCEKYLAGCDESCPTPHEYPALAPAKIHPAWVAKQELVLSPKAPILAGLSGWTVEFIKRRFPHLTSKERPKLINARCGLPQEFFHAPTSRRRGSGSHCPTTSSSSFSPRQISATNARDWAGCSRRCRCFISRTCWLSASATWMPPPRPMASRCDLSDISQIHRSWRCVMPPRICSSVQA